LLHLGAARATCHCAARKPCIPIILGGSL
jgi:hypothetical protein